MDSSVILHDKTFVPFIPYGQIEDAIDKVAEQLNRQYGDSKEPPVLVCVLNGSILFTGELLKRLTFPLEVVSLKLSSYEGTKTTGVVHSVLGLSGSVEGKEVIVAEDIVDTGNTLEELHRTLRAEGATGIKVCTLLFKPEAFRKGPELRPDFVGMEIPNRFIVGFGLDYDQLGRNLRDIYVLDTQNT